ncbi:MAG: rRNA pseudouridine synthase [Anaerolineaceae bacterium]|nr:rRNA pseudouridine synthase [Anaerolineaceae bacterium]
MNAGMVYIAFYKPDGVLTAFTDPEGRDTLKAYIDVPDVYSAGRLDMDSEGLLFLTNDGSLAHRLTDPTFLHPKTYLVQVEGIPQPEGLAKLESGVEIKGRQTRRCQVMVVPDPDLPPRPRPVTPHGPTTWLRIVLREGMKRQIRHMTAAIGLPTLRLVRVAIGPVTINELQPGQWRYLSQVEVNALKQLTAAPIPRKIKVGERPAKFPGNARESRYRSGARRRPDR